MLEGYGLSETSPDVTAGEEVAAVVTLREGQDVTPAELRRFVRERVASYKAPRYVQVAEALPKTATGKIVKHEIKVTRP